MANGTGDLSEWAFSMELRRVREENHRLRTLLDAVDEGAVILSPDRHFVHVNHYAAQMLRRECGISEGQIIGRIPDEIGVPLSLARPGDEMLTMARTSESWNLSAGDGQRRVSSMQCMRQTGPFPPLPSWCEMFRRGRWNGTD